MLALHFLLCLHFPLLNAQRLMLDILHLAILHLDIFQLGLYLLLQLLELVAAKGLVPSQINQHLDPPIELQERLRRERLRQSALERAEGEHGCRLSAAATAMLSVESLLQHDFSSYRRIQIRETEKDVSQSVADIEGITGRVWWANRVAMLQVILGCRIGRDKLDMGWISMRGRGYFIPRPAGRNRPEMESFPLLGVRITSIHLNCSGTLLCRRATTCAIKMI